jgi:hypothetical protein
MKTNYIFQIIIMLFSVLNGTAQPACSTDIDRNFSVLNASQALNRAAAARNIVDAKNELHTAYLNLEQVMNYGALQWKECISCNPNLAISGYPNISYMNVARRLVNLSRIIYDRPNYNEFLGLVETMENNVQIVPYCGDYVNTEVNVSGVAGIYDFGEVSGFLNLICDKTLNSDFVLSISKRPFGRVLISCPNDTNQNERRFYWLLGKDLVFIDSNGAISSVLIEAEERGYWEGPYKANKSAGITHYIRRRQSCKDPSFLNKTIPVADAFLVEPPYGGSSWAKDGDMYWIISGSSYKYFIVKGNNLEVYDRCGTLLNTHQREYAKTGDDGKQIWGGYTKLPDGSRGGNWYIVWDDKQDLDPCADPSWINNTIPNTDAFLVEPPYGGSSWAKDGNKYWIISGSSYKYFIVSGSNLIVYDRCGKLLATYIWEYSKTGDDGKQIWGGYTKLPDGSRSGNWYIVWN